MQGDEEMLNRMMAVGGKVLARTLDENRRSALHFAAALGKVDLVRALVHNGADVDLGDKEGERGRQGFFLELN
jgi:signal recognition particle protein